jgi:poly-gamma-glutamate capsule biosynthesis protein CapA/YwtB (metallophosphatase superfamily)
MLKIYSFSILSVCHSFTSNNITTRRSFMWNTVTIMAESSWNKTDDEDSICIGFTGDVMLGRGIDAILPYHVDGTLHESYMKHARGYVDLAIRQNGQLPSDEIKERGSDYIWGDLVETFNTIPDIMIINLETSLTTSNDYAKGKGINYRAHPLNVASLKILGLNSIVTLANNHVLDWGVSGLKETIKTLNEAQIKHAGAGNSFDEATRPVAVEIKGKNIAVVAVGLPSAGVPMQWRASNGKSGVYVKDYESSSNARDLMNAFNKAVGDEVIKIVSCHMGPNWHLGIPEDWRRFAHTLIDHGADFVVAHSSHHVKGIEVYRNKMISYGLGDFLNDYEGMCIYYVISFALSLMYYIDIMTVAQVLQHSFVHQV